MGNIAGMEVVRKWYQGALELEPRLAAFGPVYAGDPAMQFCLQSARRNLGDLDGPKKWYADFVARQPEGRGATPRPRNCGSPAAPARRPRPVVYCRSTDERPYLDGKLDDPCWQSATPLVLSNAAGDSAGEYRTEARMAYDHEFFYLAVRCTRPAERREDAGQAADARRRPARPRPRQPAARPGPRLFDLLPLRGRSARLHRRRLLGRQDVGPALVRGGPQRRDGMGGGGGDPAGGADGRRGGAGPGVVRQRDPDGAGQGRAGVVAAGRGAGGGAAAGGQRPGDLHGRQAGGDERRGGGAVTWS